MPPLRGPAPGSRRRRASRSRRRTSPSRRSPPELRPLYESSAAYRYREDRGEGVVEIYTALVEIPTNVPVSAARRERLHLQVQGLQCERGRRGSRRAARRAAGLAHELPSRLRYLSGVSPGGYPHNVLTPSSTSARARSSSTRGSIMPSRSRRTGRPRRRHIIDEEVRSLGGLYVRRHERTVTAHLHQRARFRPSGGARGDALLPLRPDYLVRLLRRRPHPRHQERLQDPGRPAYGGVDPLVAQSRRPEEVEEQNFVARKNVPQVRDRHKHRSAWSSTNIAARLNATTPPRRSASGDRS